MQHRPSRFVTEGGVFVCGSVVSGGRFAFGHLQIELVQPLDLFFKVFKRAAVVDQVIGSRYTLVAGKSAFQ